MIKKWKRNKKRNKDGCHSEEKRLLFEGEYFNGKRSGKGKEYYHDEKIKLRVNI